MTYSSNCFCINCNPLKSETTWLIEIGTTVYPETSVNNYQLMLCYFNLTFRGPCIVIYSYNWRQKDAQFLNFILVNNSTCFGETYSPSIKVLFANLMLSFFIKSTVFLYMFRALLCSSSGGLNCIYASSRSWYHHPGNKWVI